MFWCEIAQFGMSLRVVCFLAHPRRTFVGLEGDFAVLRERYFGGREIDLACSEEGRFHLRLPASHCADHLVRPDPRGAVTERGRRACGARAVLLEP